MSIFLVANNNVQTHTTFKARDFYSPPTLLYEKF
jgi:hypothetical protein